MGIKSNMVLIIFMFSSHPWPLLPNVTSNRCSHGFNWVYGVSRIWQEEVWHFSLELETPNKFWNESHIFDHCHECHLRLNNDIKVRDELLDVLYFVMRWYQKKIK